MGTGGVLERSATPFLTRSSLLLTVRALDMDRLATRISAGNLVAVGDNGASFSIGDGASVDVAELVGDAVTEAGHDTGEKHGGDGACRRVVVPAGITHEPLVAGSELWVDESGPVGGLEQRRPEAGIALLGRSAGLVGESG